MPVSGDWRRGHTTGARRGHLYAARAPGPCPEPVPVESPRELVRDAAFVLGLLPRPAAHDARP